MMRNLGSRKTDITKENLGLACKNTDVLINQFSLLLLMWEVDFCYGMLGSLVFLQEAFLWDYATIN
ncbi:hypothetical protein AEA09_08860 [Lysinibacillus contaminans]|uniref:Uncharacterized protein n=1 Tax=Lysinibacillus contaminans TaxID=1293441 RepID=A0ABR5K1A6_9BACI|nr:hypothetical protein AEA09_08860 [Lysinibacillus contaminans]